MTVENLIALLAKLPPTTIVRTNGVGNLVFVDTAGDYLGCLDVKHGRLRLFNYDGEPAYDLEAK